MSCSLFIQRNRYDGLGRRREKIEATTTNRYIYKDWLILAITDGAGSLLETYTHGADLSGHLGGGAGGIGGILSSTQNSTPAYYHYDFNGNIVQVSASNQLICAKYTYSPFGEILFIEGSFNSRYQFSTKENDAPTKLTYYGYRFYSPALSKWLNRDPLQNAESLPDTMNLYCFATENPIDKVDVLGLQAFSDIRDCSPIPPPPEYSPLPFSNGGCYCLWWGGKQEVIDIVYPPISKEIDCGKCNKKETVTTYIRKTGTKFEGAVAQILGAPPCLNYVIGSPCQGEKDVRMQCVTIGGCKNK